MTDDDKLAQLDDWERWAWNALKQQTPGVSELVLRNLETIERCQRIRSNLKLNPAPPQHEGMFAAMEDGRTMQFRDGAWVECHASFSIVPE